MKTEHGTHANRRMALSAHGLSTLACLMGLSLLVGCVTENAKRPGQGLRIFEGPDDLDTMFVDAGTYHGVKLLFELNAAKDLPEGEYQVRTIPHFDGRGREIYRVGNIHEITFAFLRYEVGGFYYKVERGTRRNRGIKRDTRLFVFKRRRGDMEITYAGQRILVKARGYWTPSIYSHRTKGEDETGRWVKEILQIGFSVIEADSRHPGTWVVDGVRYNVGSSEVLQLDGALHFEER